MPPNNYIRISELEIIFFLNLNFHIWGDILPHTEQQHLEKKKAEGMLLRKLEGGDLQ